MSVLDHVVEIIGCHLGAAPGRFRLDTPIDGESESPDSVERIIELDEQLGITIPDHGAAAIVTAGRAVQSTEGHISKWHAASSSPAWGSSRPLATR